MWEMIQCGIGNDEIDRVFFQGNMPDIAAEISACVQVFKLNPLPDRTHYFTGDIYADYIAAAASEIEEKWILVKSHIEKIGLQDPAAPGQITPSGHQGKMGLLTMFIDEIASRAPSIPALCDLIPVFSLIA